MKSWKSIVFALSILGWCGCAHLATVRMTEPRIPTIAASDEKLAVATQRLTAAEREQPLVALGNDLSAVELSLGVLEQQPSNSLAQSIYNFSVARAVENAERANLQPWRQATDVPFNQGSFLLTTPKPIDQEHDPSRYDLFPVDALKIGGTLFKTRPPASGIGAPLVAVARSENPQFHQDYKLRRLYAPATAVIQFSGQKADLKFVDPFQAERVALDKRIFPLAVDLSAPIAMLIARERPERLGFARVINPQKYADTARLTQLQPFDPARTPVIFVHGLQETPVSWTSMIDSLRDDPGIREHYQFWVYSYPSGYPYPYSAALFRQDLDGIDRAFPNHKRVVLIGHSMGGMICRLMITDAGDKIWRDLFATSPAKTPLSSDTRKLLEESLVFNHRADVQRVVFISTPHRGSKIASGWIGRIGSALVRTPRLFTSVYASTKPLLVSDPAARTLKRMPNSVDTLEPNDRFVRAVDKLPITRGIPYHSIIGDRGRGDTPNSSDGVVPYWSSHLEGAQSELIVNSDHGAQFNPDAIREVERILKENLTAKN
ncbi:MAG TPA: alpha/beta fold hydrolase [Chthoniobacterales bacterium]|jgi:pimeloyl-ACP methyl ester carboxylesterase|nr:alpha/beta fold hydrolase [Chthoniobacterales bacterium]